MAKRLAKKKAQLRSGVSRGTSILEQIDALYIEAMEREADRVEQDP